jgi:hypothetical protein
MSYPLRLPPELDSEARERCQRLGISLNAFIAVALDAYLRGAAGGRKQWQPTRATKAKGQSVGKGKGRELTEQDLPGWRFFHPDPDMWPYVDPDFQGDPIFKRHSGDDEASMAAIEAEYWRTRERPAG